MVTDCGLKYLHANPVTGNNSAGASQQPPPGPPMLADTTESSSSSSDESDVAGKRLETKWPKIQANENAQWRRKAMAKRALLDSAAAVDRDNSNQDSYPQDTGKQMDGPERCNGTTMAESAANEQSEPTEHPFSSGAVSACSDILSHGSNPLPADLAAHQHGRALGEIQPTMSESLNAITDKFLKIDVIDGKQDLSRFIAYLLDTVELLTSRVAFLEAKDADSSSEGSTDKRKAPQPSGGLANVFVGKVLHRVFCDKRNHQHDETYYEDKPTYRDRQSVGDAILMGDKIVHDLDNYLDAQQNICFLVINESHCGVDVKHENHKGGQNRRRYLGPSTEQLRIVAPLLQKALLEVAQYDPFPPVMGPQFTHSEEMRAPYPFLFHHRDELVELASNEMYEGVLRPLLEFLNRNYDKEYEEANALFEQGIVTLDHISKLFKPHQMVISRGESNALEAHILYRCHGTLRDRFTLSGWSWRHGGNGLDRKIWTEDLDDMLDEQMRIVDLKVHPAKFARVEDLKHLEERGARFWDMRGQAYVCYTGWDEARRYYYVRTMPPALGGFSGIFKLFHGSDCNVDWRKSYDRYGNLPLDAFEV